MESTYIYYTAHINLKTSVYLSDGGGGGGGGGGCGGDTF